MPRAKVALKLYAEPMPLFSRFNVEPQIASIYSRTVGLPGGGAIVIDHAEALTAIDVNSGKSKAGKNQGDTASHTNLEAAAEVGRQLRLRDIGGLVVVDFIDMRSRAHRHEVEKVLREAMKADRARHEIGRIGENGLVEINRQRIRSALQLRTRRICPTCEGVGRIISPELLSLNLVRRIEGRAATGRLARAKVVLHSKVADYVQNNRRRELADLERAYRIVVEIVGDPGVELSTERYEWFDVPAWEVPSVPERRAGDEDDDRSPAVPAAPADGEPVEAPAVAAAPPQAGTGTAGRCRRREAFPPQAPAARRPEPGRRRPGAVPPGVGGTTCPCGVDRVGGRGLRERRPRAAGLPAGPRAATRHASCRRCRRGDGRRPAVLAAGAPAAAKGWRSRGEGAAETKEAPLRCAGGLRRANGSPAGRGLGGVPGAGRSPAGDGATRSGPGPGAGSCGGSGPEAGGDSRSPAPGRTAREEGTEEDRSEKGRGAEGEEDGGRPEKGRRQERNGEKGATEEPGVTRRSRDLSGS